MKAYHVVYAALASLVGFAEVTTATPATSGMLAQSVCISPMTFLVVAITPVETMVTAAQQRMGVFNGNDGGEQ